MQGWHDLIDWLRRGELSLAERGKEALQSLVTLESNMGGKQGTDQPTMHTHLPIGFHGIGML